MQKIELPGQIIRMALDLYIKICYNSTKTEKK